MKKLIILFVILAITFSVIAQSPQKMSYQAVIRNSSKALVTSSPVGMRVSILQGTTPVYVETHAINTNANGLVTIEIGGGTYVSGVAFSAIDWSTGTYSIKTETDPTGGTDYTAIVGTSQLLSVPYALYSKTAQTADYNNLTNLPNLSVYLTSESDPVFVASPAYGIPNGNITNWNTAYGWGNHAGLYRSISWVPDWTDLTGKPSFATVATSGNYNDLTNKPALFDGSWANITGKPTTTTGYGITDAVTITGDQTISGIKTFTKDLSISGLTVGLGKGAISSNTVVGYQSLYSNTTGAYNTANGYQGLYFNTTGFFNTANGYQALYANTTGAYNTANGSRALGNNHTGDFNTAEGSNALNSNTAGNDNTANGLSALYYNTTGNSNTANGRNALFNNTTGNSNTANGFDALYSNQYGGLNTANGDSALYSNTTGYWNTAVGHSALASNWTGSYNTAIGFQANVASPVLTNATAIGANAVVNASNKVRIGNSSVTVIEGQVAFSYPSDMRLKQNIKDFSNGLDFILKLRPVEYQMKQGDGKTNFGFIAQDIETLVGTNNSLLTIGADADRTLGLRYTDFIAPMVKAIQELSQQNNELKKEIGQLKAAIEALKQH